MSQFTRFMYAQTIMHKNDSGGLLGSSGIQFNPNLVNLGVIGLDSFEYINTPSPAASLMISASGSSTSLITGGVIAPTSSSSATATHSRQSSTASQTSAAAAVASSQSKALVKSGPFSGGFSLFGLIRKGSGAMSKADEQLTSEQIQLQKQQQAQQQQQQQSLLEQQQKLKQQKTDLKTIGQYIKSFESIVIKSLRQYTLTTSVNLQARVLELLTQLIFLKVCLNYDNCYYYSDIDQKL